MQRKTRQTMKRLDSLLSALNSCREQFILTDTKFAQSRDFSAMIMGDKNWEFRSATPTPKGKT